MKLLWVFLLFPLPIRAIEPETIRAGLEFIRFVREVTPPYHLDGVYLTVEGAYAPLRYLPGKHLSMVNWELTALGWSFPSETSPMEAQATAAAGVSNPFGLDTLLEVGATLNDHRGWHWNVLTRLWLVPEEWGIGRWRLTAHAQTALSTSWTTEGYSSVGIFPRWTLPVGGGQLITHGAYIWNGTDGTGLDRDDETHAGLGLRYPDEGSFAGLLTVSGYTTASFNRSYVTPSVIWRFFGLDLVGGFSIDLSPAKVHQLHFGLHAFGEPK